MSHISLRFIATAKCKLPMVSNDLIDSSITSDWPCIKLNRQIRSVQPTPNSWDDTMMMMMNNGGSLKETNLICLGQDMMLLLSQLAIILRSLGILLRLKLC